MPRALLPSDTRSTFAETETTPSPSRHIIFSSHSSGMTPKGSRFNQIMTYSWWRKPRPSYYECRTALEPVQHEHLSVRRFPTRLQRADTTARAGNWREPYSGLPFYSIWSSRAAQMFTVEYIGEDHSGQLLGVLLLDCPVQV